MPPHSTARCSSCNKSPAMTDYLTRILAALVRDNGGELRIPLRSIRAIADSESRQMLVEDTNVESDELVLRFGTKHSAVYPVEPECKTPSTQPTEPNAKPPSSPVVRPPLSPAEELKLEATLRAKRVKRTLGQQRAEESQRQREQERNDLSEILGPNSTS